MAKNKAANEVVSDVCSGSSNCKDGGAYASQSCSEGTSEADSPSDQNTSSTASGKEECLADEGCLQKRQRKASSCSGSSEEQFSSCSEVPVCKSSKCCLKSKRGTSESASGSEDTESSAAKSPTDATPSGNSSKDKKTQNENKENNKQSKSKEDSKENEDKSGWTLSEDALLRSMKEANDGLSWEDIGKSLNRAKNECKGRWKAIKDQTSQETPSEDSAKGKRESETQSPAKAKAKARGRDCKTASSTNKQEAADAVSHSSLEYLSEHDLQRQYWYEHIGQHLYPASIRIEPDAHFSQSDCRVLEMADARYQNMRWLETQARFYNETGRMVPLEVIRRKCEDAAVRTEADIAGWLESIDS